ncbi:MAG: FecR domain-containing protein [Tannerellaceae bacterium]|jgi:ferric-dicitrate binding protein FerR (iron transport regulator)|nr:FecR domain-containing protein [Tannerellaceae bacterium]
MEEGKNDLDALLTRYIKGLYTQRDAETLWESVKSNTGYEQVEERMEQVWNDIVKTDTALVRQQDKDEARRLLKRIRYRGKTVRFHSWLKSAVAVFLLLIAGGATVYFFMPEGKPHEIQWHTHYVAPGATKRISLADGSRILLNAGSSFSYPAAFGEGKRIVQLEGEAFFDIVKSIDLPFVVQIKDTEIEVLGTSFNVKAYEEDSIVSVMVETGKVRVSTHDNAMIQLAPAEHLVIDRSHREMHKYRENVTEAKAWIKGGLYFNKTPVRNVINELMRHYNCIIVFGNGEKIPDEYISGSHDNKSLDAVLTSIHYATGIKYRKENDRIVLYK